MRNLIVSTMKKDDLLAAEAIAELSGLGEAETVYTDDLKLLNCAGCNYCWLKTPGLCPIKDDYEQLMVKFLQYDNVIVISEARFGFITHTAKNLFDRILPLMTMYLKFYDGQMRHVPRYDKLMKIGFLYTGDGDGEYLKCWLERAVLNLHGKSLGAFELSNRKELINAIGNN